MATIAPPLEMNEPQAPSVEPRARSAAQAATTAAATTAVTPSSTEEPTAAARPAAEATTAAAAATAAATTAVAPAAAEAPSAAARSAADAHRRFVAALFERHCEMLSRYVTGLLRSPTDAEDVVQETYARVLDVAGLEQVESRARAYLFRVATNLAHDRFRAREPVVAADPETLPGGAGPDVVVDFAQGLAVVERALLELKPRCRQVFLLRASEQLDYDEIGRRLGVSKRTVEREMRHALDVCQRRLQRSR